MITEVLMPKMGMTMEEGTVIEWFVTEGAKVEKGDILLSVETDKATLEVESFSSGVLLKILVGTGKTVSVLSPIGLIGDKGEDVSAYLLELQGKEPTNKESRVQEGFKATPAAKRTAKKEGVHIENVLKGGDGIVSEKDVLLYAELERSKATTNHVKATPTAAAIAKSKNVDFHEIKDGGRVYKQEVLNAIEKRKRNIDTVSAPVNTIALKGMRKAVAENVVKTWAEMPMVTNSVEVDVTEALKLCKRLSECDTVHVQIGITDLLLKILGFTLKKYQNANVRFKADRLCVLQSIDVGLAIATEKGLTVPVVRNVDRKSIYEINTDKHDLIKRARTGELRPDDYGGAGTTLTNVGGFRAEIFTPLINYPESFILGTGQIKEKPAVVNGEMTILPLMWLNFTYDHRVFDGVQAADVLNTIRDAVELPGLLIG